MHVLPHIHGGVVADDVRDVADIDSTGYEIRADEATNRVVYEYRRIEEICETYIWISCFLNLSNISLRVLGARSLE